MKRTKRRRKRKNNVYGFSEEFDSQVIMSLNELKKRLPKNGKFSTELFTKKRNFIEAMRFIKALRNNDINVCTKILDKYNEATN